MRYFEVEVTGGEFYEPVSFLTLAQDEEEACRKVDNVHCPNRDGEEYDLKATPTTPAKFTDKLVQQFTVS